MAKLKPNQVRSLWDACREVRIQIGRLKAGEVITGWNTNNDQTECWQVLDIDKQTGKFLGWASSQEEIEALSRSTTKV